MQSERPDKLNLPHLRSNPFDVRPLDNEQLDLMVGREQVFTALGNSIRFFSPKVVALVGERGSGRTSVVQNLTGVASQTHSIILWPTEDVVTTLLNQLYCDLMMDFEPPPIISNLVNALEKELGSRSDLLPLIVFDVPYVNGSELSEVICSLMPVLTRLRALTVITMTPGQLSAFPEELMAEMDVTEPLKSLNRDQMAALIGKRVHKASRSAWTAPAPLLDMVMKQTGGHVGRAMRLLRDFVDHSRGMPVTDSRNLELSISYSERGRTEVEDSTFQRVAEAAPPILETEIEVSEKSDSEPLEKDSESEEDEQLLFPSLAEAAELWGDSEPEEIPAPEPALDHDEAEVELDELQEDEEGEEWPEDWDDEEEEEEHLPEPQEEPTPPPEPELPSDEVGGAEVIEMAPGTEPPPSTGLFGGLRDRNRRAKLTESADQTRHAPQTQGPQKARQQGATPGVQKGRRVETPDPSVHLWVADDAETPYEDSVPPPDPPERPEWLEDELADTTAVPETFEPATKEVRDALANIRRPRPVVHAPGLDVNVLMGLGESEMAILEQAIEREISPSDEFLQTELDVGRPRLSQLYNGMARSGILTVRKEGRSRMFRISVQARDHLTNLGERGE